MLVYGDRIRTEDPRAKLLRLADDLEALAGAPPGIERHGRLVALFIEASELFQGVADAEFSQSGCDAASPLQDRLMAALLQLAAAVTGSWRSGFLARPPELPHAALRSIAASRERPERIEVKTGEGYAFYALYPEAYAVAAQALDRSRPMQVIGIRSIGAGLAAMVAAAGGAERVTTVRPVGHPFRRELALAPELTAGLVADSAAAFAVVDEGPGLSGSSFGAVGDFLENQGVSAERVAYFPSHAFDLGPQAEPRHRARWARARRHVVDFDALVLRAENPAHRLERWITDLVGTPLEPLRDISAGGWRALRYAGEDDWPAANVQQERRKYLARTESGTWLLKFAGLGRLGLRKLERARALAAAGFTPQVAGYRHGFLVERWRDDARALDPGGDRSRMLAEIARYLAFRAKTFAAEPASGASLPELLAMARHNVSEGLGGEMAAALDRLAGQAAALEARVRRVETDNRMHAWEWLRGSDGALIKTDALDHHDAHDLIGCQDIAWDVVGAVVELDFSGAERDDLCAAVERETGRAVDPDLLAVLTPCYLAFQLGSATLGAQSLAGWPQDAARLRTASDRYAVRLRDILSELS